MTVVKICGVTSLQDGLDAARAGADLIGLNFYPSSPRAVTPFQAEEIVAAMRLALPETCPRFAGVFVNVEPGDVLQVIEAVGLDAAQISGDEPAEHLRDLRGLAFKSIRPPTLDEALRLVDAFGPDAPEEEGLPSLVLDAYHPALYGGTGEIASVKIARAVRERVPRLMLAGGLTPANVRERVAAIRPWGVDVASGVEGATKGVKDAGKMRAFVTAARAGTRS
jgi:phosphoribosylanthranilate isomerase